MNDNYTQSGKILVSVYTASGAIPIEGAMVTISGADKDDIGVKQVVYTDRSGNTEKLILPTPPASMSKSPTENAPYAKYNIEIDKEGFFKRSYINVPVFADTTSIQPVNLIPLTEFFGEAMPPSGYVVSEGQNPSLKGGS